MRTMATLNLPSSTSGICGSVPPWVPVPAQSAPGAPDTAAPDGAVDGAVEPADGALDGAVDVPGVAQAPTTTAAVITAANHDRCRLITRPPPRLRELVVARDGSARAPATGKPGRGVPTSP